MSRSRFIVLIISILSSSCLFSQSTYKTYIQAEETFYDERFGEALPLYEQVVQSDAAFEDAAYKLEICRLLSDRQYTDMSVFNSFEEEMKQNDKFYFYWKGRVQLEEYQFEEAIQSLQIFLRSSAKKSEIVI